MFSLKMQTFILHLFFRKTMFKKDQKIYNSNIAFYRMISYLKNAKMVETEKIQQFNQYTLTERGKLFGMWISNLPDNKFLVETLEKRFGNPPTRAFVQEWLTDEDGK